MTFKIKTMREFLISVFFLGLFFGLTGIAVAADLFSDVSGSHKNNTAIEYLKTEGVIQGYEDGTFKPEKTVNRAELLKILIAGQGIEPDESIYKDCFPDVGSEWFAKYVCYAQEQDWVGGYPDGTFQPAKMVNKVEALKMLVNSQGFESELVESVEDDLFEDTDKAAWYAPFLKVAKDKQLLEEIGSNFNPTNGMTRAGISENIFRVMIIRDLGEAEFNDSLIAQLDEEETEDESYIEEVFVVSRIIDGDTVELENEERVRLIGIDTPELSASDCYSTESKDYLADLIEGKTVRLEGDTKSDDIDKYDRLLRYIYVGEGEDEVLVNKKMLEEGYAYYYDSYDFDIMTEFEDAEKSARDEAKGLWTECEQPQGDSEIVIHFVFYDGEVPRVESDEYVEIKNNGTEAVNLQGYKISGSKGDESYVFPDLELGAGETVKVYTNQGDYSFENTKAIWSNSGETVYLYDPDDNLVDNYSY